MVGHLKMKKFRLELFLIILFCTGCSWEIFPYIRNLTDSTIVLSISSNTSESLGLESKIVLWKDSIFEINHENDISFSDTLKWESIDKNKHSIVIPSNSTALVQLPHGWQTNQYSVTIRYHDGKIDSILQDLDYMVVRKDGKTAEEPRAYSDDKIFINVK